MYILKYSKKYNHELKQSKWKGFFKFFFFLDVSNSAFSTQIVLYIKQLMGAEHKITNLINKHVYNNERKDVDLQCIVSIFNTCTTLGCSTSILSGQDGKLYHHKTTFAYSRDSWKKQISRINHSVNPQETFSEWKQQN